MTVPFDQPESHQCAPHTGDSITAKATMRAAVGMLKPIESSSAGYVSVRNVYVSWFKIG
jgi:hypothetical protein